MKSNIYSYDVDSDVFHFLSFHLSNFSVVDFYTLKVEWFSFVQICGQVKAAKIHIFSLSKFYRELLEYHSIYGEVKSRQEP